MSRLQQHSLWICVIPFLLVAFWLGARNLGTHPFWGDELDTVRDTRGFDEVPYSPADIWAEVSKVNPDHAPGYFVLLNAWGRLTSWTPQTLRFMSVLIGLLGIAVTYRLGRQWLSAKTGFIAAIILSVSPFYIFYFTQARVYLLACLLSTITVLIYLALVNSRKPPSRWQWAALFLAVAATLYSHYLASIVLIGIGLYHLLFVPKNRRWWMVVAVSVAGALLFAPWVWVLMRSIDRTAQDEGLHNKALAAPGVLVEFVWMFSNGVVVLMLGLLAVAVVALRGHKPQARHARQMTMIALFAFAAALIANALIGLIAAGRLRYLLPLWPLFALLIGFGITTLKHPRGLMTGVVALWIVGGLWNTLFVDFTSQISGASSPYPLDQITETLSPRVQHNDLIVNYIPEGMAPSALKGDAFEYYYRMLAHMPIHYTIAEQRTTPQSQAGLDDRLRKTFTGQNRIWVVYMRNREMVGLPKMQALLAETHFQQCAFDAHRPAVGIELYVADGENCPSLQLSG